MMATPGTAVAITVMTHQQTFEKAHVDHSFLR